MSGIQSVFVLNFKCEFVSVVLSEKVWNCYQKVKVTIWKCYLVNNSDSSKIEQLECTKLHKMEWKARMDLFTDYQLTFWGVVCGSVCSQTFKSDITQVGYMYLYYLEDVFVWHKKSMAWPNHDEMCQLRFMYNEDDMKVPQLLCHKRTLTCKLHWSVLLLFLFFWLGQVPS